MFTKGSLQKGSLLLLLVSNLLLCKNAASMYVCTEGDANCHLSLQSLFERAILLSHYMHTISTELFLEYDKEYAQNRGFLPRALNTCHTASLPTPGNLVETENTQSTDLLNLILSLLHAWKVPLDHLVAEVHGLRGVSNALVSKTTEVKELNKELLQGVTKMLRQVNPGDKYNEDYPVWSELPSLQSALEDTRLFTFYSLFRCLRRDTSKVDTFLKFLNCRINHNNC